MVIQPLTVSLLNQRVRELLETHVGVVWIEGEISNFTRAPSGHLYFSLKDDAAQVRAAFFRGQFRGVQPVFRNGMQVLVRARVSVYETRGDYQLIVEHMEESGLGALQRAFEQLKAKLAAEGLFSPEHKKPIPSFVHTLGVITSPSGAALQDILHTLERRYPLMRVIVYPTLVQGKEASAQIVQAIENANRHNVAQLLILARGGGSLEDLFAFNEENVARAIFASRIPIISGVGHETDVTIADFVADLRAATPTAAAELASADQAALLHRISVLTQKLIRSMQMHLQQHLQRLKLLEKSLVHPNVQLERTMQRIDELQTRLISSMQFLLSKKTQELGAIGRAMHALSPLAVLDRGYSITMNANGQTVRSVRDVQQGDVLETRLPDGMIKSTCLG